MSAEIVIFTKVTEANAKAGRDLHPVLILRKRNHERRNKESW
jgi:hypothetical protein